MGSRHREARKQGALVRLLAFSLISVFALVGRATAAPGEVTDFPVPGGQGIPLAITAGSDGKLWFTTSSGTIGRIAPSGRGATFRIATQPIGLYDIARGADGNVWFVEALTNRVGRITPTGEVTEFPLPTPQGNLLQQPQPFEIVAGPNRALWVSVFPGGRILPGGIFESTPGEISRVSTNGEITGFSLGASFATSIVAPRDGSLWFFRRSPSQPSHSRTQLARLAPSGQVDESPVSTGDPLGDATADREGNIWFTENEDETARIVRVSPEGRTTRFLLPIAGPRILGTGQIDEITLGPDGNLWFTVNRPAGIGRITPAGQMTLVPLGKRTVPRAITAGPDGNVWFTLLRPRGIGRIVPGFLGVDVRQAGTQVKGRRAEFKLACSGGSPREFCTGVLRIRSEATHTPGLVTLASREYSLRSGKDKTYALFLDDRALQLLASANEHRRKMAVAATLDGGSTMTRPIELRRRSTR